MTALMKGVTTIGGRETNDSSPQLLYGRRYTRPVWSKDNKGWSNVDSGTENDKQHRASEMENSITGLGKIVQPCSKGDQDQADIREFLKS